MGQNSSSLTSSYRSALNVRHGLACLITVSLVCAVSFAQDAVQKAKPADDAENLLKEFPKGWLHFSSEPNTPLNTTWQISREAEATKEPVLVCLGKPDGYVRTEKEYENFELGLEWKYPADPNGNSGILLFTIEKDMIWPKSVQVQLHRPTAGSVIATNGAKLDNPLPAKDLSKPVNEWNSCVITSVDGKVTVTLNDHKVGEVTGCMPQRGCVGLQSEGSEIHFRNLWIKPLPPSEKRLSSRKMSARHKKIPACPPDMYYSQQPETDVIVPTHHEVHRAKLETLRISRALRRYEITGRIRPWAFRNLSPFAAIDGPGEVVPASAESP